MHKGPDSQSNNLVYNKTILSNLRLPQLADPNCIFTSRSVIKITANDLGSIKIRSKNSRPKKRQKFNSERFSDRRAFFEGSRENKYQKSDSNRLGSPDDRVLAKRMTTQPEDPPIIQKKSINLTKQQLIQKIKSLTIQLSTGRPDYINYKTSLKKSNAGIRTDRALLRNSSKKIKTQNSCHTEPLNYPTGCLKQTSRESPHYQEHQKQTPGAKQLTLNISKYNIKLKPVSKNGSKHTFQTRVDQKQEKVPLRDFEFRGWTKYGKINEEIQH